MIRVRFCVLHSRHARVLLRVRAGLPRGKAALRPFAHDGSRHLPRERITRYVADAHGRDARNPGGVPKPENHRRHNPFDMRSTHPPPPPSPSLHRGRRASIRAARDAERPLAHDVRFLHTSKRSHRPHVPPSGSPTETVVDVNRIRRAKSFGNREMPTRRQPPSPSNTTHGSPFA